MAALWFTPQYSEFASFHYPFAALSDSGFYPFVHYWLEYPPLFPYLSVGVYRLFALFLEPQSAVHFKAYLLALQALMGLFDVANAALIYRLVARFAHVSHATFAALVFCLSFLASFVASGFFDGMTLCFMLLALAAFIDDRPVLAGVALGLGVVTKILPIVLLPALVKFRKGAGSLSRMAVSFVLTVGLLWGSFFLVDWELAVMPVRSNSVRPPWETVWALMEKQFQFGHLIPEVGVQPMPGVPETAIQAAEALKVEAAGMSPQVLKLRVLSRFSTDLSAFPKASNPMLHLFAGLLFLALFLLSWRTVRSREPYHVIPYSGFLLVLLLLCSKGWSPQFVVFPAAFILLCYPSPGGATAFLALMVVNFLEMPVWLSYVRNIEFWGPITLGGLVLARMALLLGLGWRLFWDTVPHE
jgi:hypothetical protein